MQTLPLRRRTPTRRGRVALCGAAALLVAASLGCGSEPPQPSGAAATPLTEGGAAPARETPRKVVLRFEQVFWPAEQTVAADPEGLPLYLDLTELAGAPTLVLFPELEARPQAAGAPAGSGDDDALVAAALAQLKHGLSGLDIAVPEPQATWVMRAGADDVEALPERAPGLPEDDGQGVRRL